MRSFEWGYWYKYFEQNKIPHIYINDEVTGTKKLLNFGLI